MAESEGKRCLRYFIRTVQSRMYIDVENAEIVKQSSRTNSPLLREIGLISHAIHSMNVTIKTKQKSLLSFVTVTPRPRHQDNSSDKEADEAEAEAQ